jgi:hypothetical protein
MPRSRGLRHFYQEHAVYIPGEVSREISRAFSGESKFLAMTVPLISST